MAANLPALEEKTGPVFFLSHFPPVRPKSEKGPGRADDVNPGLCAGRLAPTRLRRSMVFVTERLERLLR